MTVTVNSCHPVNGRAGVAGGPAITALTTVAGLSDRNTRDSAVRDQPRSLYCPALSATLWVSPSVVSTGRRVLRPAAGSFGFSSNGVIVLLARLAAG
jgi:hypothetical protein